MYEIMANEFAKIKIKPFTSAEAKRELDSTKASSSSFTICRYLKIFENHAIVNRVPAKKGVRSGTFCYVMNRNWKANLNELLKKIELDKENKLMSKMNSKMGCKPSHRPKKGVVKLEWGDKIQGTPGKTYYISAIV